MGGAASVEAGGDAAMEEYNATIANNELEYLNKLETIRVSAGVEGTEGEVVNAINEANDKLRSDNEQAAINLAKKKGWPWGSSDELNELQNKIDSERNKLSSTPLTTVDPSDPPDPVENVADNVIKTTTPGITKAPITGKAGTITPDSLTKDRENYQEKTKFTQTQAGLAVVAGVAALGTISAAAILGWYANDNTGCYQINNGVRGKQMPGGPGTGNYYDWNNYPNRCACSPISTFSSGATGASGLIGAGIPTFCGNIFSKKNITGSKIESGTGFTILTGTTGAGTAGSGTAGTGTAGSGTAGTGTAGTGTAGSGTPAGQPPYPVCEPIKAEVCNGSLYYSYYAAGPLSLITSAFTTAEQAAQAAGSASMNVITIGIILAFIALVLFIVLNFITKPKGT